MRTLVALVAASLVACGGAGDATQCAKGSVVCVTDSVARVCDDDGSWAVQQCTADQTCMGSGGCVARTDIACNQNDSGCVDSTHAVVCNSDGKGFQAITCPTGTTCSGFGTCIGSCVVGSSTCKTGQIVSTCTDGFTTTDSNCMPGTTTCVTTSGPNAVIATAACMPASCTPQGTVCGDKASDPASTDPNFASTCVPGTTGLHWQSEQCPIGNSCAPGGTCPHDICVTGGAETNGCNPCITSICAVDPFCCAIGFDFICVGEVGSVCGLTCPGAGGAGCVQHCVPGQQRCNGNAIQTCDATGNWGAITACQPTATGTEQVCQIPVGSPTPVCGDAVCASAPGACEPDGYHPCQAGKVATAGQECAIGVCVSSGGPINGFIPGSCVAQCNPGDSRCDGFEAYEGCDANSRWSNTTTQCPANGTDQCVQYIDPTSGASKTLCGQCAPGRHRCTDSGGVVGGANPNTYIESCDSTGHFGSPAMCAQGQCQGISGPDAACVLQCVPNSTVCIGGSPASPPDPVHPGTTNWGTCDANGNLPTTGGTACGAGTSCRKHADGTLIGTGPNACVQCVGSNNESGLVDTNCPTSTTIETCQANNTWNTPTTCPATSPYVGQCQPEQLVAAGQNEVCGPGYTYAYCSYSYLITHGYPQGCTAWNPSVGATDYALWGGVSDCCNYPPFCRNFTTQSYQAPAACY